METGLGDGGFSVLGALTRAQSSEPGRTAPPPQLPSASMLTHVALSDPGGLQTPWYWTDRRNPAFQGKQS